jgi:hypothetical protein
MEVKGSIAKYYVGLGLTHLSNIDARSRIKCGMTMVGVQGKPPPPHAGKFIGFIR